MKKNKLWALGLVLVFAVAIFVGCGQSGDQQKQKEKVDFPTKAITYMIAFDPGGQSDLEARRQQPLLEKYLGQSIIVTYKVGGGGAVGWTELVNEKPTGYYMGGINVPHIILQPLARENAGYETEAMKAVCIFQATPIGLGVPVNSPYDSLEDFVNAGKENPGKITIAGSGTFAGHDMAQMQLENLSGAKFEYVPFTGAAPQLQAFLGGHVQAILGNSNDLVQHQDKMKILAIGSGERYAALPDVPTFKELGYDMTASIDRGVAVPADTDDEIVAILEEAFMKICLDEGVQNQMLKEGFEPKALNAADSA
ncbi:MAG: tripartite tricarboxylate transporter substrate binding protein, partial [Desulfotomaculaceae bacterium]